VTITVICYSWAPSGGDHLFTCGAIHRPPHTSIYIINSLLAGNCMCSWAPYLFD